MVIGGDEVVGGGDEVVGGGWRKIKNIVLTFYVIESISMSVACNYLARMARWLEQFCHIDLS